MEELVRAVQNLQAASPAHRYQIQPPEPFNFREPAEFAKWLKRFERFRDASGLSGQPSTTQVNTLLYSMGPESEDLLARCKSFIPSCKGGI